MNAAKQNSDILNVALSLIQMSCLMGDGSRYSTTNIKSMHNSVHTS